MASKPSSIIQVKSNFLELQDFKNLLSSYFYILTPNKEKNYFNLSSPMVNPQPEHILDNQILDLRH